MTLKAKRGPDGRWYVGVHAFDDRESAKGYAREAQGFLDDLASPGEPRRRRDASPAGVGAKVAKPRSRSPVAVDRTEIDMAPIGLPPLQPTAIMEERDRPQPPSPVERSLRQDRDARETAPMDPVRWIAENSGAIGWGLLCVAGLAWAWSIISGPTDAHRTRGAYRLVRTSEVSDADIHLATFDSPEGARYNRENCEIAAGLFENQPGVVVEYSCVSAAADAER